ncbi:hypothetical protein ACFIQF_22370 [Comamonas sp. J-3]|uniref:hypothetical protein n=1 Tax=Comamonas trifloxystrobinivorans TaxID=3350256 RepID=UPI00372C7C23
MTGFTIFYGALYFLFWLWLYKAFTPDYTRWGATLIGLFGIFVLHLSLAVFGHLSMIHHQMKKRHKLKQEKNTSEHQK